MSSVYFRIEVYGKHYGCPEFDLMGYHDINELLNDCWESYHAETAEDLPEIVKVLE